MNPWPWQHFLSFTPEFNLPSGKRIWPIDCTERLHQPLVPDRTVSEKIHRAAALEADILFLFFTALWFKAMMSKALCTARKSKSQKFSLSAWLSSCGWVCILWLAGVTGGECQQVPLAGEMHTQCPCSALRGQQSSGSSAGTGCQGAQSCFPQEKWGFIASPGLRVRPAIALSEALFTAQLSCA